MKREINWVMLVLGVGLLIIFVVLSLITGTFLRTAGCISGGFLVVIVIAQNVVEIPLQNPKKSKEKKFDIPPYSRQFIA